MEGWEIFHGEGGVVGHDSVVRSWPSQGRVVHVKNGVSLSCSSLMHY